MDMEQYFLTEVDKIKQEREDRIKRELVAAGVPNVDEWDFTADQFSTDASFEFKSKLGYTYRYCYESPTFKLIKIDRKNKSVLRNNIGDWEYMVLTTASQLKEDEDEE